MEWIYFVIIFFYIVSAINKATKKREEAKQKLETMRKLNKRVEARPVPVEPVPQARSSFQEAAEAVSDLPLGDVMRFLESKFSATAQQQTRSIETVDYDLTARFEPSQAKEDAVIEREHSSASHFHTAEGLRSSLHDRSSMATAPQFASATFSFAAEKQRPTLRIKGADLRKYYIISEILGKPKALRKHG